jgi:hypothetical protein
MLAKFTEVTGIQTKSNYNEIIIGLYRKEEVSECG